MEPGPIPEVEVIEPARPGRRRRYSAEDKRRIVEETRVPGQSVSSVSRRFGVSPSQVFKWRRLVEEGTMSVLGADEAVVPESDVKELKGRIRELERLLGEDDGKRDPEGSDRDRARKKTLVALALAETGRFSMRVVAEALGLSRSNLIERRQLGTSCVVVAASTTVV